MGWSFLLVVIFAVISIMSVENEDEKIAPRTFIQPPGAVIYPQTENPPVISTPPPTADRAPATSVNINSQSTVNSQDALRTAVNKWSKAWSSKDMPTYLSMYASDYLPAKNVSREVWAKQRTERIESKKWIRHQIRDLKIHVDGIFAQVKFTQVYADEQMTRTDQKTMRWVLRDGRWWILLETTN